MKETFFLLFSIFMLSTVFGQDIDGTYVGLEKICWKTSKSGKCINTDDFNSKSKWFHQNILKIKGDSVFLDQNPISIYKKDTSFSASDGAFLYFTGLVSKTHTSITFKLVELFCDYCGEFKQKQSDGTLIWIKRTKLLSGKIIKDGIVIDNYLYKKVSYSHKLLSEFPPESIKTENP